MAMERQLRSGDAVGDIDGVIVLESDDVCAAFVPVRGGRPCPAAQRGDSKRWV